MAKKDYSIKTVEVWKCPADTGIPLLTMPNIPRPLHGCPPRKFMGQSTWDRVRKRCYFDAGYKCEICGEEFVKPKYAAHELYTIDYKEGTSTFERCIAIDSCCHDFIHSGRLITMYKNKNPLYPKKYVLKTVEKGFKLIHKYNKEHPEAPLRAYATFLEYLKTDLAFDIGKLIDKYGIEFYAEPKHIAKWENWRLIWNGKEYPTPYKSQSEWVEAMDKASKNDNVRAIDNPFQGEAFDEINAILNSEDC